MIDPGPIAESGAARPLTVTLTPPPEVGRGAEKVAEEFASPEPFMVAREPGARGGADWSAALTMLDMTGPDAEAGPAPAARISRAIRMLLYEGPEENGINSSASARFQQRRGAIFRSSRDKAYNVNHESLFRDLFRLRTQIQADALLGCAFVCLAHGGKDLTQQ